MSLPDLVIDSKLDTVVEGDCVRHTFRRRGKSGKDWKVDVVEKWTRKCCLGCGGFGTVWLEECQEPVSEGSPRLRAVKEILIGARSNVDYGRELLAITKFSHPKYTPCFVQSWVVRETPSDLHHHGVPSAWRFTQASCPTAT
ncbi:hypothetical protein VTI74DRAFT_6664 [Chaetomium olivicolor]